MGKTRRVIVLYMLSFMIAIALLQLFFIPQLFSNTHLLNWDAVHYDWIQRQGYSDFRVAFFPLFPLIWRVLSINSIGIVIFNASLYLISFYFLMKILEAKPIEVLLYLTIPSFVFFYLPYSEAVFFASAVLLLFGIQKNKKAIALAGLLFCTITRPSFTILLPALILMVIYSDATIRQKWNRISEFLATSFVGVLLVGLIQFRDTGEWFRFFEVQSEWGNQLQVPTFPLRSWGGNMITRLDGVALVFGLVAGVYLLWCLFRKKAAKLSPELILSLAFLGGITLSVLLFRGGSLFSLNRFVFVSPFFIVGLHYFLRKQFTVNAKQLMLAFLFLQIYWLAFASFVHIQAFLKYLFVALYLLLLLAVKSKSSLVGSWGIYILVVLNFVFQLVFYCHFLLTRGDVGFIG